MTEFVYDGNGNRVKKSGPQGDTTYIDKLYEINGASTDKYIFAGSKRLAIVNQTDTYYYHQGHLGGTSIVTDGNGNKVEQVFYKPFGEVIEDTGSVSLNHKYTGQELDSETDLYFYNARYYNPNIGRFVGADTIHPALINPQAFNRYSYVNNNPLLFVDPTGHFAVAAVASAAALDYFASSALGVALAVAISAAIEAIEDVFASEDKALANPFKGEPGSTNTLDNVNGTPKQDRTYGSDVFPDVDIAYDHDHKQGRPHAHDWGRPEDGSPPTAKNRSKGRSLTEEELEVSRVAGVNSSADQEDRESGASSEEVESSGEVTED